MSKIIKILKNNIKAFGSISLKEYMTIALYHPENGYYTKEHIIGEQGDYVTAPEISQVFGELLASWIVYNKSFFSENDFNYLELGPGKGTLCKDIFRTIEKLDVNLYNRIKKIYFFEKSSSFIKKKNLNAMIISNINQIEKKRTLVIANEFFDAIPVNQYIKQDFDWYERRIVLDKNKLAFTISNIKSNKDVPFPKNVPNGSVFEYSEYVHYLLSEIFLKINKFGGAFLIIDYSKEFLNKTGTLHSIFKHKHVKPFYSAGKTDLSISPDFNFYKSVAKKYECKVIGPFSQRRFLKKLGINQRIDKLIENNIKYEKILLSQKQRLIDKEQMGEKFKVLIIINKKTKDLIFENE